MGDRFSWPTSACAPNRRCSTTFAVPERGYRLLLGLRRRRAWSTIRPKAFHAALDGLRSAFRAVVADVDADVEGEDDGGSIDIEERNVMARATCATADVVVAVGVPGMKGIHSLAGVVTDLIDVGTPAGRIVAVINQAPRGARIRAEIGHTLEQLLPTWSTAHSASPVFVPERRADDALRDNVKLPD